MKKPIDLFAHVADQLGKCEDSLADVAKASGVSKETIRRIKNGSGSPTYENVRKLYEHFAGRKSKAPKLAPAAPQPATQEG